LCGGVDVVNLEPLANDEERMRKCTEQRLSLDLQRLGTATEAASFGRAAQAVYPFWWLLLSSEAECTNFIQTTPMIHNWGRYEGICARAILVLPQCSIFSAVFPMIQRLSSPERERS